MTQNKPKNSLQQRVHNYLRDKPISTGFEESEEEAAAVIIALLQKAESDLKAAQERVDRLKRELAKSKAQQGAG